jgi:hypothetical protein
MALILVVFMVVVSDVLLLVHGSEVGGELINPRLLQNTTQGARWDFLGLMSWNTYFCSSNGRIPNIMFLPWGEFTAPV